MWNRGEFPRPLVFGIGDNCMLLAELKQFTGYAYAAGPSKQQLIAHGQSELIS